MRGQSRQVPPSEQGSCSFGVVPPKSGVAGLFILAPHSLGLLLCQGGKRPHQKAQARDPLGLPPAPISRSYLTSSMTLSLGASLTSSSFMPQIWSPANSLSSEGPPVRDRTAAGEWRPERGGQAGGTDRPLLHSLPGVVERGPSPGDFCRLPVRRSLAPVPRSGLHRLSSNSHWAYLRSQNEPPQASRFQPQSQSRRRGHAGSSPVGERLMAADHIP